MAKKKKKKKIFSLLRAPEARPPPSSLPAGWRGPFPARDQHRPQQRRQEAKPLLMLFRGAPVRPPPAARLFRAPGPPPSARAQCLTRGRGSDSCQRRRRWRRPSVCAEEKPETDPFGSPSSPFPRSEASSLWTHRESVLHSAELFPPLRRLSRRSAGWEVTALEEEEEEAAAAALASPPPVRCPRIPERRCRRHRRSPPPAALGPGWVELRCPRISSHCSART